jgi:hypothetical protein
MAQVFAHFEWRRVVVIHDYTIWGTESAAAFISSLDEEVPDADIYTAAFSYANKSAQAVAGHVNVTDLVDEIARVRGRVVFLAVQSSMAREVFVEFDRRTREGLGWFARKGDFAWLLAYVDTHLFINAVS